MQQKALLIFLKGLSLKLIKSTFLKGEGPTLNFCYFNINSAKKKFNDFQEIINGNVGVVSIAETYFVLSLLLRVFFTISLICK